MIKKKLAIALIAVAIVGVFSSGAIYAYFNDTETSTGNSFTAGTLDLTLSTAAPSGVAFTATDMKPGSTGVSTITLTNAGSIDGTLTGQITSIVNGPGATPEPEPTPDNGELADAMAITIFVDVNGNGVFDSATDSVKYSGKLSGATTSWDLGSLAHSATTYLSISYSIDYDAVGNEIMGDTCTFNIGFALIQA